MSADPRLEAGRVEESDSPAPPRVGPVPARERGLPAWLSAILVLGILAAAGGAAALLVKTKPKPAREPDVETATLVEVAPVRVGTQPVAMRLAGQVLPARKLVLMPEVGGSVVWLSDALVPGAFVKAGQPLVRIDPRDYALALQAQGAQLSSQELALEIERGRRKVAEREWELFKKERQAAGLPVPDPNDPGSGAALALRAPHLESAEVAVGSARSALDKARLALSRTTLSAPFNAFVQAESAEKGQLVTPGFALATLVGTDAFWVQVSIPIDKLAFVKLPERGRPGSRARVWLETGTGRIEREGAVLRLLGDLDPVGRLARLLVEIDDPFFLREGPAAPAQEGAPPRAKLPLLLGSFVRVEIEGVELADVVEIPRKAVFERDAVHVVGKDDKLEIRRVQVVWSNETSVFAKGPLADGDRVVVTLLAAPVEGTKLRVVAPKRGDGAP
jgi:multidrug efflux pump subunit AcrA (membrane-fusion protein)